ncbi:UNVERIFIED_CONTAM: hypothetical protein HDU68_000292 [Siphonaria sp. JEL0065]|nr:hypothetical protein HDU68_000292 [Siphonaria sp. JEL0065]
MSSLASQPASHEELIVVEEEELEEEEFIDEIYDIIDSAVPRTDRCSLPALTFRTWILGKFNHKEHVLIYIFASAMSQQPYALYNIIGQKYFLGQELSFVSCLVFALVTQCVGYGLAGLCRRFLVRPSVMLWPSNLANCAFFYSMHNEEKNESNGTMSRFKFFWVITGAMAVWELLPGYVAPALSAISILCWFSDRNKTGPSLIKALGSANSGVGFLSFTLDWSMITSYAPITTPLWAMVNQFLGLYLFIWIVIPILWYTSAFGNDRNLGTDPINGPNGTRSAFPLGFALNTPALFNSNGTKILASNLVLKSGDFRLNDTFYELNAPIRITPYFAMTYINSFIAFAAVLVHCALWYGKEIWFRLRVAADKELDADDIHCTLMDVYEEVPNSWYWALLALNAIGAIGVCEWGGFQLHWYGVLGGIALALISIVPIGVLQAISGQQIGLNVVSELIAGFIYPGKDLFRCCFLNDNNFQGQILPVMTFKTVSYMSMYKALDLVADLKLGHYMKIAPRAMFSTLYTIPVGKISRWADLPPSAGLRE